MNPQEIFCPNNDCAASSIQSVKFIIPLKISEGWELLPVRMPAAAMYCSDTCPNMPIFWFYLVRLVFDWHNHRSHEGMGQARWCALTASSTGWEAFECVSYFG